MILGHFHKSNTEGRKEEGREGERKGGRESEWEKKKERKKKEEKKEKGERKNSFFLQLRIIFFKMEFSNESYIGGSWGKIHWTLYYSAISYESIFILN